MASLVALAPGAAHDTKRWPLEHWKALAASLAREGRPMVIVGGGADLTVGTARGRSRRQGQ